MKARTSKVDVAAATVAWLGPAAYAALIVGLGLTWRGYDPVSSSMSVLGAVDSPVRHVANFVGFAGLGLVLLCFAAAYSRWFGFKGFAAVAGLLIVLAGVFMVAVSFLPCDSGCVDVTATGRWHSWTSTVPAIALPVAAILSARVFYTQPHGFGARWQAAAFWLGLGSLLAGPLLWIEAVEPALGVVQRVAIGLSLLWVSATGWRLRELLSAGPTTRSSV